MKIFKFTFKKIELFIILIILIFFILSSIKEIETSSLILPIVYIIYCIIAFLCYLFIHKRHHNYFNNQWYSILFVLITGMLIRLLCLYFLGIEQKGDYRIYLSTASKLALGQNFNNFYYGIFPHAIHYPLFISKFFKIFGTSYKLVSILNIIFSMLEIICIYLILNKIIIKNSILATLFVILNPSSILLILFTGGESIYSSLIFICFLIILNIYSKKSIDKNNTILYIILGLFISIANFFRPTAIILIIAIILSEILIGKKFNKIILLRVMTITLTFILTNFIFQTLTRNITGYNPPKKSFGWNLYVGGNYSSKGTWNPQDGDLFKEILTKNMSPSEIQTYFCDLAHNRYKNLIANKKIIRHFMNKTYIWSRESSIPILLETSQTANTRYKHTDTIPVMTLICFIYQNIVFLLMVVSLVITKKEDFFYRIISLYIIGSICLFMIIETATRYKFAYYSIIPTITIIGFFNYFNSRNKEATSHYSFQKILSQ